jgi:hypothetical protein
MLFLSLGYCIVKIVDLMGGELFVDSFAPRKLVSLTYVIILGQPLESG